MKARLLFPILGLILLVSACSEQSQVNGPVTSPDASGTAAKIAQINLTMEQAAFVDEMYYMDEDLSVLLNPSSFEAMSDVAMGPGDRRGDARGFVDMAAIIYYNLIVKANPGLDEAMLTQLRELIAASNQARAEIIRNGLANGMTREEIAALLKTEHENLMNAINGRIGPDAIAAVEALKLQLEQEREQRRLEMMALRIDREVAIMTQKLGLTEDEAAGVKEILIWQQEEIARIRAEYKDNPEGLRAALQDLLARLEAKMIGAIGEEKWQQWKDLRSGRTGGGEVRDPVLEQVKHLTQLLGLNADQQAIITKILTDQQNQIKALVQQYGRDRRGLAEALKALQERTNALILGTLTPEQIEIWNKYRRGGMTGGGMGGGRVGG